MNVTIRLGTRGSLLALAQTDSVRAMLSRAAPGTNWVVLPMSTEGDRHPSDPDRRDFTGRIDQALEGGEIDAAVHSAKDLPAESRRRVDVAAYPRREDPRDCLVLRSGRGLRDLPPGTRLGSSSLRRKAQLLRRRPDLQVVRLHGNVNTRLVRVQEGQVDGAILALAGMRRLGRQGEVTEILPLRQMLPAPGQGALAVEVRRSDSLLRRLVQKIDHPPTRWAVVGERTFAAAMGGDCNLPLAALGKVTSGRLNLHGAVYSENGARCLQGRLEGPSTSAVRIAQRLAGELRRKGAEKLLHDVTPAGSST